MSNDEIEKLTGYKKGSIEDKLLTIFDGIYQNGLADGQTGLDYFTYKVDEAIEYTAELVREQVRAALPPQADHKPAKGPDAMTFEGESNHAE